MLLRNLDRAGGLCNRTQYIVFDLHNPFIEAQVANGTHAVILIIKPQIPLTSTED